MTKSEPRPRLQLCPGHRGPAETLKGRAEGAGDLPPEVVMAQAGKAFQSQAGVFLSSL